MTPSWTTCPNCGEKHDTSGRYTSPQNQERDRVWWREEHLSGKCLEPQKSQETAVPIIQIGGWLRSGKDALADRLVEKHSFVKLAMGELILEMMLIENPWIRIRLRESLRLRVMPGFRRASALVDRLGYVDAKTIRDFRRHMQALGDGARTIIGTRVWADAMALRLGQLVAEGQRIVYTGCRFPDELELFRSKGALSLWVDRPGVHAPTDGTAHITETALSRDDFDEVVDNDGSLQDLWLKADALASRIVETRADHPRRENETTS